jgi:hypothetical protein
MAPGALAAIPRRWRWVAVDLLEEVVDVRRRRELIVPVETQVAVAPVL